jgi:serine/threonine-protein kinase
MIGRTLGHYEILEPLGAGGMGEVYRARDQRLDRDVAIKVLPAEVATDPDRLARFEREAKALARLSHPNILTIHDFGHEGEVAYAVTELLQGATLREQLTKAPLTWRRVVEIGAAITDALATAHARDIIHRDLKPENVFITSDDHVKVIDFGIARVLQGEVPTPEATAAETRAAVTSAGTILGTAGYMAPEQVRGEPADARSDVFALGCVLYEMISRKRPFVGNTGAEVLSAILTCDPDPLLETDPDVPQGLVSIVERCVEKNPENRFQAIRDVGLALRMPLAGAPESEAAARAAHIPDDYPSIAVLPFANHSADPEQEYFCDGMAEEIINALAQVKGLRVVARTSAFAFKGQAADIREIGHKLGVGTVLEGSVRKAGERLRITAQLIDVTDGYHLWSERYDRGMEDVFAIQEQISLAIVNNLKVKLLAAEKASLVRRHTDNLEAHNAYLEGLYEWNKMSPEGLARCQALYRQAIDRDPEFAPPYGRLAESFTSLAWWTDFPPSEALAHALPLVERALELDPELTQAHSARGIVASFFSGDWEGGERDLRRAVELAPNDALAQTYLGLLLAMTGNGAEASRRARSSLHLDPLSPTSTVWAGTILLLSGHGEEGLTVIRRQVGMTPHLWMPRYWCSFALAITGGLDDARVEAERAFELSGGSSITLFNLAGICYRLGDRRSGDELFARLRERAQAGYVGRMFLTWANLARGDREAALRHAEEAIAAKDPWVSSHPWMCAAMAASDPSVDELLAAALP